jgi:hypothetical protein
VGRAIVVAPRELTYVVPEYLGTSTKPSEKTMGHPQGQSFPQTPFKAFRQI